MFYVDTLLGIKSYPQELKILIFKFFSLELIITVIYLSNTWISLYYISILGSYALFGTIVAIGTIIGFTLDLPLGILTDRFGQRGAFCGALLCLTIYYMGLIIATTPFQLLCLEILVGIYSALLSGSYLAWFFNSWAYLVEKNERNDKLLRSTMGNVNFIKMIFVSSFTILGGFLLFQAHLPPQLIFLIQGIISSIGFMFGFIIMVNKYPIYRNIKHKMTTREKKPPIRSIIRRKGGKIQNQYLRISPYFISFGVLRFTSLSFSTVIFPLIIYILLSSESKSINSSYFNIDFTSMAILVLSLVNSITDFTYGISSRFTGKFTRSIKSPRKGLAMIYTLNFPLAWLSILFVLIIQLDAILKLQIVILLFLGRLIISGLTSGLHWQLYYSITSSENRSSQESYQNTLNLLIYTFGFSILGQIMERKGLLEGLLLLFILGLFGVLILVKVKDPEPNYD